MKLKPLFDRVVLVPIKSDVGNSGLFIPDSASDLPSIAKVISIGSGTKDEEMCVNVGDTVLYNAYAGSEYKYGDTSYTIISINDILAIIEEK